MKFFDPSRLRSCMERQLLERGVVSQAVLHVCGALLQTSLRGVDSHGINLFPHYCRAVSAGRIRTDPAMTVVRDAPAAALLDADHGFGHHAGAQAMGMAASKAALAGAGAVSVRNSTHFGAAAYYGLMAAEQGFIGMAFTNADSLVRAHGSTRAYFGTNPVCITAPLASEGPLCLDMSTSVVSFNRIRNHRARKEPADPAWGCDANGLPSADPDQIAMLNPAGSYKGFGLGMMVEMLCGVLAAGPYAHQILPMYRELSARRSISHLFIALDPEKFLPTAQFRSTLQEMVDRVRALPPLAGTNSVMVPGDPEKKALRLRSREGIPIDEQPLREFLALSEEFEGALRENEAPR